MPFKSYREAEIMFVANCVGLSIAEDEFSNVFLKDSNGNVLKKRLNVLMKPQINYEALIKAQSEQRAYAYTKRNTEDLN
jgi:hypothetical protein